jgi:hypothetical protein
MGEEGDLIVDNKIYVNGRHLGDKPLRRENIVSSVSFEPGIGSTIRLDDKENLEWWMEIHLTKAQLEEMLKGIA